MFLEIINTKCYCQLFKFLSMLKTNSTGLSGYNSAWADKSIQCFLILVPSQLGSVKCHFPELSLFKWEHEWKFLPQSISVLLSKQPHNPLQTAVATPSPVLCGESVMKQASTLQERAQHARSQDAIVLFHRVASICLRLPGFFKKKWSQPVKRFSYSTTSVKTITLLNVKNQPCYNSRKGRRVNS